MRDSTLDKPSLIDRRGGQYTRKWYSCNSSHHPQLEFEWCELQTSLRFFASGGILLRDESFTLLQHKVDADLLYLVVFPDLRVVDLAPDSFDVIGVANNVACRVCNCEALEVHSVRAGAI